MLLEFQNYLTFENIYLWTNFGILPFWLMLLLIPNSKFTQFLVNSVLLPLILASAYIYLIYLSFLSEETLLSLFSLYLSLENLYTIFATESFLVIFWFSEIPEMWLFKRKPTIFLQSRFRVGYSHQQRTA